MMERTDRKPRTNLEKQRRHAHLLIALAITSLLFSLFLFACEKDDEPKAKREIEAEAAKRAKSAPVAMNHKTPRKAMNESHQYLAKGDFKNAALVAKKAFEKQFAENPKAPDTWHIFLKICEAQAKAEHPATKVCYDRFFAETADIDIAPDLLANAYRWRLVIALREENAMQAQYFWNQLDRTEEELIRAGLLEKKRRAQSIFLHGGVLKMQGKLDEAIAEMRKAITMHFEVPDAPIDPAIGYYERYMKYLAIANRLNEALEASDEYIAMMERSFSKVHPFVAVAKLHKINILLDMGERERARSIWGFVHDVFSKIDQRELPSHIDKLYVETMIRLDVARMNP